eukprot:jgi/Picsp_1/885/NSC_04373-R1_---NA---
MLFLTDPTRDLSTSVASVSSRKTFGPKASGPKAHTDPANTFEQVDEPNRTEEIISDINEILPCSRFSASPWSKGSAIIVNLFFLLGVSAKHFKLLVSITVSQNDTTGSATLTSTSLYNSLRSFITESK